MTRKGKKLTQEAIKKRTETRRKNGWWKNSKQAKENMSLVKKGKMPSNLKELNKNKWGKNNPMWKGNNVGYDALHEWITNHKPKKEFCEKCHKKKELDLSNISGLYKRDINDYDWLCRKCHSKKDFPDGRIGKNINLK